MNIYQSNVPSPKAVNFTGTGQVVRKEMYVASDNFVRIVEKLTNPKPKTLIQTFQSPTLFDKRSKNEPIVEVLAKMFRRSSDEVKSALGINDESKLNKEFELLRTNFDKTKKVYAKAIKENNRKNLPLELKSFQVEQLPAFFTNEFKTVFTNFLKKNNLINEEGVFDKLPAKFAVLKKGSEKIDDNLSQLADKVFVYKGVELDSPKAKKLIISGLDDKGFHASAKSIQIKDSTFGELISEGKFRGKNIVGSKIELTNERTTLLGDDVNVSEIKTKGDVLGYNIESQSLESTDGAVHLLGPKNIVGKLKAKDRIFVENFIGESIESTDAQVDMRGTKNSAKSVKAKFHIKAKNLTAHSAESTSRNVELVGEENNVDHIIAAKSAYARNLTAKTVKSLQNDVLLLGEKNSVSESIKAKEHIYAENLTTPFLESLESNAAVFGKNTHIDLIKAKSCGYSHDTNIKSIEAEFGGYSSSNEYFRHPFMFQK